MEVLLAACTKQDELKRFRNAFSANQFALGLLTQGFFSPPSLFQNKILFALFSLYYTYSETQTFPQ